MELLPFVAPIFPAMTAEVRLAVADAAGAGRPLHEASRRRAGIVRETLWIQERPEGDLLLALFEAEEGRALERLVAARDGVLARNLVGSMTGREEPPRTRPLVTYTNPDVHAFERSAFVLRVRRGALEARRRFAAMVMGPHALEHDAARRRWGVAVERVWEMRTAEGDLSFFYLEGDDIAATLRAAALSQDGYDAWWRERLMEIHEVDVRDLRGALASAPVSEWSEPRQSDLLGRRLRPHGRPSIVPL